MWHVFFGQGRLGASGTERKSKNSFYAGIQSRGERFGMALAVLILFV
jgi:hypothetical protein